jgi:hypothetical protein
MSSDPPDKVDALGNGAALDGQLLDFRFTPLNPLISPIRVETSGRVIRASDQKDRNSSAVRSSLCVLQLKLYHAILCPVSVSIMALTL